MTTEDVTPPSDCFCRAGCILMSQHDECYVPSEKHPTSAQILEGVIRLQGTDWVRDVTEEIEQRLLNE